MKILIGKRVLEMGSKYLTELKTANEDLHDVEKLRRRLEEDGYLFIKGFHDRDLVLKSKKEILLHLHNEGALIPGTSWEEGIISPENKEKYMGGLNKDKPALLDVVNAPKVMDFFNQLFSEPTSTFDYKFLRAVPNGQFTAPHYDIVFMGQGTKNIYTMWTPLDDISYDLGTLAVLLSSQHFEKIKQTYGKMDVDRDKIQGTFSEDPVEIVDKFGGHWATAPFEAGDVIIFGMYFMHASTTNTTNRYRLSCDTRFQPASETKDARWSGTNPTGHTFKGTRSSIDEAKIQWGLV